MLNRPEKDMLLIGNFWCNLYPFALYFVGAYIREYRPVLNKKLLIGLICSMCLVTPALNLLVFRGESRLFNFMGGQEALFIAIESVLFFLLLYQIKTAGLRTVFAKISVLSLDMYLCCYIFDRLIYPHFLDRYFEDQGQFGKYIFIIVPLVFAGSFLAAWAKDILFKGIGKMWRLLH